MKGRPENSQKACFTFAPSPSRKERRRRNLLLLIRISHVHLLSLGLFLMPAKIKCKSKAHTRRLTIPQLPLSQPIRGKDHHCATSTRLGPTQRCTPLKSPHTLLLRRAKIWVFLVFGRGQMCAQLKNTQYNAYKSTHTCGRLTQLPTTGEWPHLHCLHQTASHPFSSYRWSQMKTTCCEQKTPISWQCNGVLPHSGGNPAARMSILTQLLFFSAPLTQWIPGLLWLQSMTGQ